MPFAEDVDLAVAAQQIRDQVSAEDGGQSRYKQFLDRLFRPSTERATHDSLHEDLLGLGICGICTTNYDHVLESASISYQFATKGATGDPPFCEPIDLCDEDHRYKVARFLRGLDARGGLHRVLHLHGSYDKPMHMVVTIRDFQKQYGQEVKDATELPLATLHQRVLWALAALHPFVFVGFSFADPYFSRVLEVAFRDFDRSEDSTHFALYPSEDEGDQADIEARLRKHGVTPVFYPVRYLPGTTEADHSSLHRLVTDIRSQLSYSKSSSVPTTAADISRRMLKT